MIKKILFSDSKVVGLRFYNAFDIREHVNAFTVVAVGIREDGSEISGGAPRYLISVPNEETETHWRGYARTCVLECKDMKDVKHYAAFFSKSVIEKMLNESGDGIKLIPASRKFEMKDKSVRTYSTMMAIGATSSKGSINVTGDFYQKSLDVCPYLCPVDEYLLAPFESE